MAEQSGFSLTRPSAAACMSAISRLTVPDKQEVFAKRIANEQQMTAEMNENAAMRMDWGPWGPWAPSTSGFGARMEVHDGLGSTPLASSSWSDQTVVPRISRNTTAAAGNAVTGNSNRITSSDAPPPPATISSQ